MRKLLLMAALVAMLTMLVASAAFAVIKIGGPGDDTIYGTLRHDTLVGRGGDDRIFAFAGTDDVFGGRGDDRISAGRGEDFIRGFTGDDILIVGGDKDSDEIRCGAGYDIVYLSGNDHSANNLAKAACEEIRRMDQL